MSFGPIARHYAVGIDVCPAYHAWRKGAVEKAAGVITQRWSRTLGDEVTADQAQAGLDRLCVRLDGRKRRREGITTTVGALAQAEGLRPVPARYPAVLGVSRTVSNQARISFRGNTYSVPPGHTGRRLLVRHRLGDAAAWPRFTRPGCRRCGLEDRWPGSRRELLAPSWHVCPTADPHEWNRSRPRAVAGR